MWEGGKGAGRGGTARRREVGRLVGLGGCRNGCAVIKRWYGMLNPAWHHHACHQLRLAYARPRSTAVLTQRAPACNSWHVWFHLMGDAVAADDPIT